MILALLAAASTAAAVPPPKPEQGFARAYVEAQLAQKAKRDPKAGVSGPEAAAMRKTYLDQLSETRKAEAMIAREGGKR